ncbi:hypothetical protein HIM_01701 [Hirsutella minnesotensis 3608]|nr:hypothetical protein HIM_01701 [Hirsutella minnesotensis 3608]
MSSSLQRSHSTRKATSSTASSVTSERTSRSDLSARPLIVRPTAGTSSTARVPPGTRSSGVARPVSANARPTSAGSVTTAQTRRAPTHARAKSTATGLHATAALRPPSRDKSLSAVASSASTRSSVARGGTALPPTLPCTPPPAGASRPTQAAPKLRPAFTTLQQHYSPAKTSGPKPLTSTFLAPPSPSKLPANVAATVETSKLQAELLQLHLLHRDAAPIEAQWRASAREQLGRRFDALHGSRKELAARERAGVERDNLLALRRWGEAGARGLEERVQLLADILSGIWALSEPGGRYGRTVRHFERWASRVREVEQARVSRERTDVTRNIDSLFIDRLDASWTDECASMARRLQGWRSQLDSIDDYTASPRSSSDDGSAEPDAVRDSPNLERMLAGSRSLIEDMLVELDIMEDVQREAFAREDEWVQRMNQEPETGGVSAASAVWREI